MSRKKTRKSEEEDQVEELLRAAQDDVLLSLCVDSHISHLSDVERRFQALKASNKSKSPPPKAAPASSNSKSNSSAIEAAELKAVLGDDLSARFAALKASMPLSSSSSSLSIVAPVDDDAVDEVEKLMRWAKDAARLDPSPPSDDEQ